MDKNNKNVNGPINAMSLIEVSGENKWWNHCNKGKLKQSTTGV